MQSAPRLDRDPQFLKMVEIFINILLTIALQDKNKEGGDLDAWVDGLKKNTKIDINQEVSQMSQKPRNINAVIII